MYNNMKWNYSEYKLWIDEGSPINLDVIQLHICDTNIANIETINNLDEKFGGKLIKINKFKFFGVER